MGVISFPNLFDGVRFYIDRVAFSFFGVELYWYGVLIAIGFMLSVLHGSLCAERFKIKRDDLYDFILICAPAAIIGARLFYVAFDWHMFRGDLWSIFNFRHGGLAIYGGVFGAFGAAYLIARIKGYVPLRIFDFTAPYFAFSQAIGRWGNFVNQESFGVNTTLPWGMTGDRIVEYLTRRADDLAAQGIHINPHLPVHPTFLYESIWNFLIFFFLIRLRKTKKIDGEVFFAYMVLYGFARIFIEGLRTDSLMLGPMRISQVLGILFVLGFGFLIVLRRMRLPAMETKEFYDPTFSFEDDEQQVDEEDKQKYGIKRIRDDDESDMEEEEEEEEEEKAIGIERAENDEERVIVEWEDDLLDEDTSDKNNERKPQEDKKSKDRTNKQKTEVKDQDQEQPKS